MYQYIQPAKVLSALQWYNPLYKDTDINRDCLSDAAQDDAELCEALSAEHCPLVANSYRHHNITEWWV